MNNASTALVLYAAFFAVAFGLRTWMQLRRTGSTGFKGISGRPGSLEWWGGVLFVVAIALGVVAPALDLAGVLRAPALPATVSDVGVGVALVGILATLGAQTAMGTSWRIGVDASETTALVVSGPFQLVRNPIFTCMLVTAVGLALLVPSVVSVAGLVLLLLAVEIQVRFVEEPHLLRTHGGAYAQYAARVGRFIPGLGRSTAASS